MIVRRCFPFGPHGFACFLIEFQDPGRGGSSGNDGRPRPPGGTEVEDINKTFVNIVTLDGDPEVDDSALFGEYLEEGETKRIGLTHDEWTRAKQNGLPFYMEVEPARLAGEAQPA